MVLLWQFMCSLWIHWCWWNVSFRIHCESGDVSRPNLPQPGFPSIITYFAPHKSHWISFILHIVAQFFSPLISFSFLKLAPPWIFQSYSASHTLYNKSRTWYPKIFDYIYFLIKRPLILTLCTTWSHLISDIMGLEDFSSDPGTTGHFIEENLCCYFAFASPESWS